MNTRRTLAFLTAVLPVLLAGMTRAAELTGKWQAEFESPVGHLKYTYDLKADGATLTGKAIREQDGQKTETQIKEGKLTGGEVSFVELLQLGDQELHIEYKGKLAADQIDFTRKVGDFGEMQIVAKRLKAEPTSRPFTLKVVKVDSEETAGEDGKGANAVDGNPDTHWHTQWQDDNPPCPHEIIIELSAPARVKGFIYLPRQDAGEVNGTIKDYEFYLSDDGKDFGKPVKKGKFDDSDKKQTVTFDPPRPCRFVKLRALSEINDNPWTSAAEIDVIAE